MGVAHRFAHAGETDPFAVLPSRAGFRRRCRRTRTCHGRCPSLNSVVDGHLSIIACRPFTVPPLTHRHRRAQRAPAPSCTRVHGDARRRCAGGRAHAHAAARRIGRRAQSRADRRRPAQVRIDSADPGDPGAQPATSASTVARRHRGAAVAGAVTARSRRLVADATCRRRRSASSARRSSARSAPSGGYMNDPEVNDYLNELGNRLVAATSDVKQDFEFFAVPDPQINAFALPGGFVGVNTGLILLAQNESELASVLAHEISHVTQHHMARDARQPAERADDARRPRARHPRRARRAAAASGQGAQAAIAGSQALTIQHQLNFTRENEYEADRVGFQRLVAAGFDPNGDGDVHRAAAAREPLRRRQRAVVPAHAPDHLRAHRRGAGARAGHAVPAGRRFARLPHGARAAAKLPGRAARAGRESSTTRSPRTSTTTRSPSTTASSRRCCAPRTLPRAKVELAKLEKMAPPHPMIEAMAGHVLMDAGDYTAAVARFESALPRYPNKMQLVYDYPEALIKAGRPADAAAFAETRTRALPAGRAAARDRRARVRGAGQAPQAARAPGRVLRVAGQPAAGRRPVRARGQGGRRRLLPAVGRRNAPARVTAGDGRAAEGWIQPVGVESAVAGNHGADPNYP